MTDPASPAPRVALSDLAAIALAVAAFIGAAALLGAAGLGVGLNVWPFGEDLNWVDMLQRGPGAEAARLFWAIDSRNPLSPWWYIAARPLILGPDWGLLALRYAVGLLLAWSAYAFVRAVMGPGARLLALSLGLAVGLWMANRYSDQIYWNFQGALACSLLAVAAYARSLKEPSSARGFYAASIVLAFVAFATYTIQAGAPAAIAYLALRAGIREGSAGRSSLGRLRDGIARAVRDAFPHGALLVLFLLVWQTATIPGAAEAFALVPQPIRLIQSIGQGLWSSDLALFATWLAQSRGAPAFVAAGLALAAGVFLALRRVARQAGPAALPRPAGLIDAFVAAALLVAPTVAVETASSVWTPGTRWPMVYQVTAPLLALLAAAALAHLTRRPLVVPAAAALLAGTGLTLSLAHNRVQNDIVRTEREIRAAMDRIFAEEMLLGRPTPLQVLLLLDPKTPWRSSDSISAVIARAWFRRDDLSFRLVPWHPPLNPHIAPWWTIRFGTDSEGVGNAKAWGGTLAYERIRILDARTSPPRRLDRLTQADLEGRAADWARTSPVTLADAPAAALCPLRWQADREVYGTGWSAREADAAGAFRWTVDTAATLVLPNACGRPARLRLSVAHALSARTLEGLGAELDGVPLPLRRTDALVYEAEIPPGPALSGPTLTLTLTVPALDTVPGAARTFGVAVRSVELTRSDP